MDGNKGSISVLKALKKSMDNDGKVYVDENELCRLAGVSNSDLRESLLDLENEGCLTIETICTISQEWR